MADTPPGRSSVVEEENAERREAVSPPPGFTPVVSEMDDKRFDITVRLNEHQMLARRWCNYDLWTRNRRDPTFNGSCSSPPTARQLPSGRALGRHARGPQVMMDLWAQRRQ